MYSSAVEKLIKLFSKFPTIGPRSAARFAFYLINSSREEVGELTKAITELKNKTKLCPLCFKSFETESGSTWADRPKLNQNENLLCSICSDQSRDKTLLCIVEKEIDLETIEKTNRFKGLYFILGGVIAGVNQTEQKQRIEQRLQVIAARIKQDGIKEIILALNPTMEGQNTALLAKRKLEPFKLKITQLGLGLPMGGELEYADEETIASALEGRK